MHLLLLCQAIVAHRLLVIPFEGETEQALRLWGIDEDAREPTEVQLTALLEQRVDIWFLAKNNVSELCVLPKEHMRSYELCFSSDFGGMVERCPMCAAMRQEYREQHSNDQPTAEYGKRAPAQVIDLSTRRRRA